MRCLPVILAFLCAVSYASQQPAAGEQSVETYGGIGVYGLSACNTLHIYDYRVVTAQYKKRFNEHLQIGGAGAYVNRVERYRMNLETGSGEPIDQREVLNLGGGMFFTSLFFKYLELSFGLGALGGSDEDGGVIMPWPHGVLKIGPLDTAYVAAAAGDPRPPYHTVKCWFGAYPLPELHFHGGVGMFGPVFVSPFMGVDWRFHEDISLSAVFEYHVPNDYEPVDFDTSIAGAIGIAFYF